VIDRVEHVKKLDRLVAASRAASAITIHAAACVY
jgi:hypothetical protein